jgi:hypothetical protein
VIEQHFTEDDRTAIEWAGRRSARVAWEFDRWLYGVTSELGSELGDGALKRREHYHTHERTSAFLTTSS